MMRKVFIFLALSAILLLAACQGSGAASGPAIEVEEAWGRPSPMVADAAAFYATILNRGNQDDRLLGADSPACGTIEMHESYMMDNGAMGMRPVEGGAISVPAGEQVELKPGGLHLMCLQKQSEINAGDHIPLTLHFENAGDIQVKVEIKEP
ncbi:MAG: copper chaperone PCu(A)C [Anaerolineae bacterium]|nr:MAG: copper chaperone PCu(A)C [Anaerolineae bacterium]